MAVPILDVLARIPQPFTEADVLAASRAEHERAGRSGGNGALMRTGPLALGYLDRPATELAAAANAISKLTHWEQDSASACILWSAAIRHAILTGKLDVRGQRSLLPAADAAHRGVPIDEALVPGAHPRDFTAQNGWVVRAFQGALAAAVGASSLVDALERAVRGGADTDTVAAIAGALGGAVWVGAALPAEWVGGVARVAGVFGGGLAGADGAGGGDVRVNPYRHRLSRYVSSPVPNPIP